jgi:hypothetical protein
MSDLPDIINTAIIDTAQDAFWQTLPLEVAQMQQKDTMIITVPMKAGEDAQLQKMMQACKLDVTDYNIVQVKESEPISWHQLRDALKPKVVILLGVLPQQLGISAALHMFAPNNFNECIWIAAPSLSQLEQQPDGKKQLWTSGLKPVFVDKTV